MMVASGLQLFGKVLVAGLLGFIVGLERKLMGTRSEIAPLVSWLSTQRSSQRSRSTSSAQQSGATRGG